MARKSLNIVDLINEPGATGKLSDYPDISNPKLIGPGLWVLMHKRSRRLRTLEQQHQYIDFVKDICYGFPCKVCKGHCTEYIKNHPMEEYLDVYMDINGKETLLGLFVWTWQFHNAVNARLNKPLMSWDTVYNLYTVSENLMCKKEDCLESEKDTKKSNTPTVYERTNKKPVPVQNNLSKSEQVWNQSIQTRVQNTNYPLNSRSRRV